MKDKGFTLVELIAIIIILGILAVYAAPRFFSAGDTELVAAEVSIATLARAQQQRAMQDTANPGYGIRIENQDGTTVIRAINPNTPIDADSPEAIRVDSSIDVQPATRDLIFNASGCLGTCGVEDVPIKLIGQTTRTVCINRQGFISQDQCF